MHGVSSSIVATVWQLNCYDRRSRRKRRMTLVKAVFLDIDGTLMDTNYLHIDAWAQAFEEVGERPPRSRIHHEVGKGSDKLIPEFAEDGKAEQASELHSEYYAKLQERGHPLPGAKELVASLVEGATRSGWPPA